MKSYEHLPVCPWQELPKEKRDYLLSLGFDDPLAERCNAIIGFDFGVPADWSWFEAHLTAPELESLKQWLIASVPKRRRLDTRKERKRTPPTRNSPKR